MQNSRKSSLTTSNFFLIMTISVWGGPRMTTTAESANSIQQFYEPVQPYLNEVRQRLLDIVPPDSQLLAESLHHSLSGGGKLLRPVVGLLAGGATGALASAHFETAAVSEMIHIATLLHDDVLDDADLRRGKQTVRAAWGNTVSILSGDYLLAQASRKLAQVGNIRIVAIFSDVLADLCDGEVEQIRSSYNVDVIDWDSYYRKSICKTASLFRAACESAGVLNGLPEAQVQALATFGKNFGIAFQIVDDLLDYTSSEAEMGKPVLDDLRNGIVNAPILIALESKCLTAEEREALRRHIRRLFASDEGEDITEAVTGIRQFLDKTGAVAETQALAERFIQEGLEGLAFMPASPERDALFGLGRFVIQRRN